ncbi:MAG: methylmalonyl-CoA mutase family protein [Anaerolineae bacterium]|jgi:methylmalonyl-CoA mutase N-terminal domain/subunit
MAIQAESNRERISPQEYQDALDQQQQRREAFTTDSGLPLEPIYTPTSLEEQGFNSEQDLGYPGFYPYTRGVSPAMYRDDFWIMGQYAGFGSAEEANERYKMLLARGQTGFSIALDLPTQTGYDADHPLVKGEVGKVGVHLGSLADVERIFDGIALEKVRQIRTTANAIGPIFLAFCVAAFEKQGIPPANVRLFIQNDVLKEYIGRGTYIFPPGPSVKLSTDVIEYCAKHLPNWVPLAMSGYHIRDSGSTAAQELAFTFANALAYLDSALARDLKIDDFAPQLFTFLAASIDFLEEAAKFRAARRFWARLLRDRFQAQDPESMKLRIFAYTLGGNLIAQQPLNNIVRVTVETLAAVLGGVQTIATSSFDEAYCLPSQEAVTVALRTQQIIAEEVGVTNVVDALGGSYALEHLTTRIEREVGEIIAKVEAMGGAVACIERGYFQQELADAAYRRQKEIDSGDKVLVGLNRYRDEEEKLNIPVFKVDPESERRQVQRLQELRATRDADAVARTLAALEDAARRGENVIPTTIEAAKAYATLGEICDTLRAVYGSHIPSTVV